MKFTTLCALVAGASLLSACGSVGPFGMSSGRPMACDDGIKAAFKPDWGRTTVVAVRAIAKGTPLVAADSAAPVTAASNLCLVKLLVGPGSTGAEADRSARSYSEGIGIEVWLPAPEVWNERIRNDGSGWVGGGHRDPDRIGSRGPAIANANMGYASATHDGGQPHGQDPSFLFLASGKVNEAGLRDMSGRAAYEQAVKTRALVDAYYGRPARFSYYDGHAQGGGQGLKLAQERPELYDGYLIAQPAIGAPRVGLASLWPQVVMRNDLGFTAMDKPAAADFARKVAAVDARAVASCDREKIGFLLDPFRCGYDPLRDDGALCTGAAGLGVTGRNADAATCMSAREAVALNKIWFGPTTDGSYDPLQSTDGRSGRLLANKHLWWGPNRGADLTGLITAASGTDMLALAMQDVSYAADPSVAAGIAITNASTPLRNRWSNMTPPLYAYAFERAGAGPLLADDLADKPDLARFRNAGRKMILWNGLADDAIPAQGAVHWYERVKARAGGEGQLQRFLRMYNIPGTAGQLPTRDRDTMFSALVDWVERGIAPGEMLIASRDNSVSFPVCVYPARIAWKATGNGRNAAEYWCQ